MEVILIQDVSGLGNKGTICRVSSGYARTHLLPRKLAIETKSSEGMGKKKYYEQKKEAQGVEKQQEQKMLNDVPESITIKRKGNEKGVLFDSVSDKHIAEALGDIDTEHIHIQKPIKEIGEHHISVGEKTVIVLIERE